MDSTTISRCSWCQSTNYSSFRKNKYNPSLILAFKISNSLEKEITDVFKYKEDE